jgi:hypothetical protein
MNWSVELRDSAGTRFNGNYRTNGVRCGSPHELSRVRAATALDRRTESAISMQVLYAHPASRIREDLMNLRASVSIKRFRPRNWDHLPLLPCIGRRRGDPGPTKSVAALQSRLGFQVFVL